MVVDQGTEQQIRDFIDNLSTGGNNSIGPGSERAELIYIDMMEQAAIDPNFAAKLELLNTVPVQLSISNKNLESSVSSIAINKPVYIGMMSPNIIGQEGVHIVDTMLSGVADFKEGSARLLEREIGQANKVLRSPKTVEIAEEAVKNYAKDLDFLTAAKEAGIEGIEIPQVPEETLGIIAGFGIDTASINNTDAGDAQNDVERALAEELSF